VANLERECRYQTRLAGPDDGSTSPCVSKQEIADIVSKPELILASIPTTSSKEATQSRGQNNNAHYNASIDNRDLSCGSPTVGTASIEVPSSRARASMGTELWQIAT
jgi:hypothetical protein